MSSTYLHLTSGNGPVECRIAVALLIERLRQEAASRDVSIEVSEGAEPDEHGPKSAIVTLTGDGASVIARDHSGTVKYIFKSPVRKGHARQNWFVGVTVIDDPAVSADGPKIDLKDVRFETMRAGGPGGQHQNTTDSAVRATHVPTGIVAMSRDERSQYRNKDTAVARLQGVINLLAVNEASSRKKDIFQINKDLERGNAVLTIRA